MRNRYLAWTLLIAACGLQAYFVRTGSEYLVDLETIALPYWLYGFSKYLFDHYLPQPYFGIVIVLTFFLPQTATILSWVFLGLRRKVGWHISLAVDVFFALPSLALVSSNLLYSLKYHHLGVPNNPEVLLLILLSLHIFILYSQPVRTLILPRSAAPTTERDLTLFPATPAR